MIELDQLTKRFGSFAAVDHVSLRIEKGSIFGLLGANGAGKTTLIRMICGILPPTSGTGSVMGYDMINERRKIKQNIGYMSQRFSLYPDLTVKENLEFYARLYRVGNIRERVDELIERYQLEEASGKPAGMLGTGIRQSVAFAAAQVHSPPLIILDEPTSGVDPLNRQRFWEEIYQLASQGVTILVTTHYMDEAERCDHIGLMNRGKLVASGEIDRLKQMFSERLQQPNPTLDEIFVHIIEQGGENEREKLR